MGSSPGDVLGGPPEAHSLLRGGMHFKSPTHHLPHLPITDAEN